MLDEFADEFRGHGTVEDEGVPVLLVHVPAGFDGLVLIHDAASGEHRAADVVNECLEAQRLRSFVPQFPCGACDKPLTFADDGCNKMAGLGK